MLSSCHSVRNTRHSALKFRHHVGGKALDGHKHTLDGFLLQLGYTVEGIQHEILHARGLILADVVDDLLCAAQQRSALHRGLCTRRELERLTNRNHQRSRIASSLPTDLLQIGRPGFDILHEGARRVPAVAEGDGAADGAFAIAADPDGDVRLLHWLRLEGDVFKPHKLAMKGRFVLGPEYFEGGNVLVAERPAPLKRYSQRLELI